MQQVFVELPKSGEAAKIGMTDAAGNDLDVWGIHFYLTDEDLTKDAHYLCGKYFEPAARAILERLKKGS